MVSTGTLLRHTDESPREQPVQARAEHSGAHTQPPDLTSPSHAVLVLAQWRTRSLPWGWSRLVRGPGALMKTTPGLRAAHVLGSGRDGGFGLWPSAHRQGLIGFFDTWPAASLFANLSPVVEAYQAHARETMVLVLRATTSRGSWSGVGFTGTGPAPASAPVATLTRAAIRPERAHEFWRHAGGTQAAVRRAPGCRMAVGLGEAPLLRQATFSIWDDEAALRAYAQQGAHQVAAQNAWQRGWFSESMFARFEVLSATGRWHGRSLGLHQHGR